MRWIVRLAAAALLLLAGQAVAQTQVSNTATLTYASERGPGTLTSNTVTFTVERIQPVAEPVPIPVPVPITMLLTMTASVREASAGDAVEYRLTLTNRDADAAQPHIVVTVPPGLHYVGGSVRGVDGVTVRGGTLDLALPSLAGGASIELRFTATVTPDAMPGDLLASAVALLGPSPVSNQAAAAVRVRAPLFTDAMTIVGRITAAPCGTPERDRRGVAGVRLLLENGLYVATDRDGMFHLEGVKPGRHVVQIDLASLGGRYTPELCADDTQSAGSATSRFVEAQGGGVQRVDFRLRETGVATAADPAPPRLDDATAAGDRDWLREVTSRETGPGETGPGETGPGETGPGQTGPGQTGPGQTGPGQTGPGVAILFPGPDYNPRAPVTRVVVAHLPGQRVALRVNDVAVDPLSFDTTDLDARRGVAVSRWTGLALRPGANRIVARVLGADGTLVQQVERIVTVAGIPARATLDPAHSRLLADGRTRPLVALRVVDGAGRPVRDGTLLRFAVAAPYEAARDTDLDQRRAIEGQARDVSARVTGDDGLAYVALEPTTKAGAVRLTVALGTDRSSPPAEIRAWLAAAVQDWVMVGFAEGTVGHDLLARHRERGTPVDGRVAFYAKGRIKGSWLLTIAYDSDRLRERGAVSRGGVDPDRYYTVYGDASRQGEDASGGGTLYLRLERRDAYVLFGDIETGFGDTQLLRYLRQVDGVKAAYEGAWLRASGFVARPSSGHVRDELRGGGITGPYRLSTRGIVPDSDLVTIEVRDRVRSERIVSRRVLTRYIDYDLDRDAGTLRFREPLLSRDLDQNAVFAIVEYETDGPGGGKTIAGGRVSVTRGRIEAGGSVLRDEGYGDATVIGGDVKVRVGDTTVLRGEIAAGGRGGLGAGTAYLAEVEHHDAALDLLAYVRQQDAGFGVGQQNAVEAGTRKIGVDARAVLAARTILTASGWTQTLLDGSATRSSAEARIEQVRDSGSIFLGGQFAVEQVAGAADRRSRLLKLGGSRVLAGGALVLSGETQIGSSEGSAAFPLRQRITAAYRLIPAVRLVGGYEVTSGGPQDGATAQAGLDLAPWSGASVTGTLNRRVGSEDQARLFAVYGIDQSVTLGSRWRLNMTVDASSTLAGRGGVAALPDPFGAGPTEDFTAATLGATYRATRWSWTGRLEWRTSTAASRLGLTSAVLRALGEGRTLAASIRAYRSTAANGKVSDYASTDLALAWRPPTSRWSVLDRLEVRYRRGDVALGAASDTGFDASETTRIVNNLAVDYRTAPDGGRGFEASLYYGAKYVAGAAATVIDVTGIAVRRGLTSRLDIGMQASVAHGWTAKTLAYSIGPSLGVSPAKGVWISCGYNLSGFHDADFSAATYTRRGPFLTLRIKFDQTSIGLGR